MSRYALLLILANAVAIPITIDALRRRRRRTAPPRRLSVDAISEDLIAGRWPDDPTP